MERTLDVRGLACPLPALRTRRELRTLPAGATLTVLATDPEAPIDVAAVAADAGRAFAAVALAGGWRLTLGPEQGGG